MSKPGETTEVLQVGCSMCLIYNVKRNTGTCASQHGYSDISKIFTDNVMLSLGYCYCLTLYIFLSHSSYVLILLCLVAVLSGGSVV